MMRQEWRMWCIFNELKWAAIMSSRGRAI